MVLVSLQFARGQIRSLLSQPPMWDAGTQNHGAAADLVPPASLVNPELFVYTVLKMNRLTLRYGRYFAFAYACYAVVTSRWAEFTCITELQEVALGWLKAAVSMRYRTYYVVSSLNHWNKHLEPALSTPSRCMLQHTSTATQSCWRSCYRMVQTQHVLGESWTSWRSSMKWHCGKPGSTGCSSWSMYCGS